MLTLPTIIERAEQPYVAIRESVRIPFDAVADRAFPELFGWLGARGIEPDGAPFIKYNVIDMANELELEFGVPTKTPVAGDESVRSGTLPAGRYASLVYRGPYDNLYDANAVLIGWAKERGIRWDVRETPEGDRFGCRLEIYMTDPNEEPDPKKWETQIAIRLADE